MMIIIIIIIITITDEVNHDTFICRLNSPKAS